MRKYLFRFCLPALLVAISGAALFWLESQPLDFKKYQNYDLHKNIYFLKSMDDERRLGCKRKYLYQSNEGIPDRVAEIFRLSHPQFYISEPNYWAFTKRFGYYIGGYIAKNFAMHRFRYEADIDEQMALMFERNSLRAIWLASKLEKTSKEKVMELYLNYSYFGKCAFGISAASETYFAENVQNLQDKQIALLMSILLDPRRDPFDAGGGKFKERILKKQDEILEKLDSLQWSLK